MVALARGDLSEMPLGLGLIAQTTDDGRVELFDLRLYASRAPDLNTTHRVLSCGLEIAQIVERDCQSVDRLLSLARASFCSCASE